MTVLISGYHMIFAMSCDVAGWRLPAYVADQEYYTASGLFYCKVQTMVSAYKIINNPHSLSLEDLVWYRERMSQKELIKLIEKLGADRLRLNKWLTNSRAEGGYDEDWYKKATLAYRAKGLAIQKIDGEFSRRKIPKKTQGKRVTLADFFIQSAEEYLSPEIFDEIYHKAYLQHVTESLRHIKLRFKLPAKGPEGNVLNKVKCINS
jgi:hypothetical protein